MKGKLKETVLYFGDNGRAFCGRLRCAGMTAFHTGRDLSGQKVEKVSAADAIKHGIRCEECGFQPTEDADAAALYAYRADGRRVRVTIPED